MSIQLTVPQKRELKPRIVVFGVGGAGGNAVNNMITAGLEGIDFIVANTDAQALSHSQADRRIQIGSKLTEGLGAGSNPEIGKQAAEETLAEIVDMLQGSHMVFVTAGMGGGTGTGAAPVIARAAREQGILTVGVITKPFEFEGVRRMKSANAGIEALAEVVDTLIIIPNQNLFRIANAQTTFAEAFAMADEVLHSGVASITDLMIKPGLINLDFADVRTVMNEMGKAMMGTGEAEGDNRAIESAEAAIANPLLDDVSMQGASGVLINISGGQDMTLYEVDEAANRIKQEVDEEANIIIGSTFDDALSGIVRVSVVATGIDAERQCARDAAHRSNVVSLVRDVRDVPEDQTDQAEQAGAIPIPIMGDEVVTAMTPAQRAGAKTGETADEAEAIEAAERVEKPDMANGVGDLPSFLGETALAAPRREVPKRQSSFLKRLFGKNESVEEQKSEESAEQSEEQSAEMPILSVASDEASREMLDEEQPADRVQSDLHMPRRDEIAMPDQQVAHHADKGDAVQPQAGEVATAAPQKPAVQAAKLTRPVPEKPVVAAQTQPLPPPVSQPSAIPAQASMQTTPSLSASSPSLDGDQLDIPAFLRR